MSTSGNIFEFRRWMYMHRDANGRVTKEYLAGLETFMHQADSTPLAQESGKMFCPCRKCNNSKLANRENVWKHLINRGFTPNYYIWFHHGEGYNYDQNEASSSNSNFQEELVDHHLLNEHNHQEEQMVVVDCDRVHDMVADAFVAHDEDEEPNIDAKKFYEMLNAANQPLYSGCREGLSKLSLAARMMNIKTDHNLPESCMNEWADLFKEYLPEGNESADSYYEIQKLVYSLGLPSEMIDICIDNCMIYWGVDEKLEECRFCKKPRFKPQGRGRNRVPYQRMWYLPITDRLKRLYQSEQTAGKMRWHAEHTQTDGEMTHPSDARAWKHFNKVYPEFASNSRNVYLGLCTDGFSPFGMSGRQYSLWPVFLTPYNLPPEMCNLRELIFLTILIPGPNHPKRSLDVFLQPLIKELKDLWFTGVRTYDCSTKTNFTMRAMLLWTISDFPAYGMLSGWTTHGRLACPYCNGTTDAFQLKNGRKTSWFDCHRRFLPAGHPYRRNKKLFKHKRVVRDTPPPYLTGEQIEAQLDYYGALETAPRGGNWHVPSNMPDSYGVHHNWHKKSIFWELPYWKDLLLRHNLDVMHIEKNFFENIMNTILNVPGKTKDNIKSRLDLPDICARSELHIKSNGQVPVPIFRLSSEKKSVLFDWVASEVKFPDGYVSNLSRCVEKGQKFSGMKSHDCHVFMQRLLPFAFAELLPTNVHEALAGIGAFFRDLSTRTLKEEVVEQLQENIPILLCNLEKIFPPGFFDVMEHLAVHLPYEALLRGPVHYGWMYQYERAMKYLKGKAKNLAKVEGSIIAGSLTEETSHFTSYYFASKVRTRKRAPRRYDDGGVAPTYAVAGVPDIFSQIGRLGGKLKVVWWSSEEDAHSAHIYILLNCDDPLMRYFESMFVSQVEETFPGISTSHVDKRKDQHFIKWLRTQVDYEDDPDYPKWLHEVIQAPRVKVTTSQMYFTRGYTFHTYEYGRQRATSNYGICVKGETDFYGILTDIIEVEFPGILKLKCVLFKCEWFDPIVDRGVRFNKFGVVDVNGGRRYNKFEPFILASQADQVSFLPYPRVRESGINWLAVIKVTPRGRIIGGEEPPLQEEQINVVEQAQQQIDDILLIDPHNEEYEDVMDDATNEAVDDEFNENDDVSSDDENDDVSD